MCIAGYDLETRNPKHNANWISLLGLPNPECVVTCVVVFILEVLCVPLCLGLLTLLLLSLHPAYSNTSKSILKICCKIAI